MAYASKTSSLAKKHYKLTKQSGECTCIIMASIQGYPVLPSLQATSKASSSLQGIFHLTARYFIQQMQYSAEQAQIHANALSNSFTTSTWTNT